MVSTVGDLPSLKLLRCGCHAEYGLRKGSDILPTIQYKFSNEETNFSVLSLFFFFLQQKPKNDSSI